MTLALTGTYAAALTAFYIYLSARVITFRRQKGINLGDGDDPELLCRMRAHGNFAEYAPLGLLLMAIAELQGESALWLHITGLALLAGRILHGVNFTFALKSVPMRVFGMILTFQALGLGALLVLPL